MRASDHTAMTAALTALRAHIEQTYGDKYVHASDQTIDRIQAAGDLRSFARGSVQKYMDRFTARGDVQDLLKACHYLLFLVVDITKDTAAQPHQ